jgi:hypothetical protein
MFVVLLVQFVGELVLFSHCVLCAAIGGEEKLCLLSKFHKALTELCSMWFLELEYKI